LRKDTVFFRQAELVLRVLPLVNQEGVFALKGGTAINFFVRDLPRLSVDIDLTYVPINERGAALSDINKALHRVSERVEKTVPGVRVFSRREREYNLVSHLLIRRGDATIKIEPNPVLRGSVFPTETRALCQKAQDLFELSVELARSLSRIFTEERPVQLWTGSIRGTFLTSICFSRVRDSQRKYARRSLFML
jgi:hypothetical protein